MAVTTIAKPIGEGRPGEETERGHKSFTRTYVVQTSDPNDGPNTVLGALGLPALGDQYTGHPTAVVIGRYPHPLPRTRLAWHVEVIWDTHSIDRDENPLNTRPEIEWDGEPYDEPLWGSAMPGKDALATDPSGSSGDNGEPKTIQAQEFHMGQGIVNAAGDPFDPPPTHQNYYPVVRFIRNEATFSPAFGIRYGNTVNKSTWNGMLPRQVWLKPIQATHEVQAPAGLDAPEILYWRVRYTFVLKAETWDLQLLNIGPNYLDKPNTTADGSTQPLKVPFLRDGQPVMDLLKADGTRYKTTELKKPTWRRWPIKREVEFAGLNIAIDLNINNLRRRRF